jgi:hypothetical protein
MKTDFILDSDEHGEFCVIPLKSKHGVFFAQIDCCDFEDISQYKWFLWTSKICNIKYAIRNTPRVNGKRTTIKMHKQILDVKNGVLIDHEDGNGLNNRRFNLRVATREQNQWNQIAVRGRSNYKGVYWHIRSKKWRAQIAYFRRRFYIGQFDSEIVNGVDIGEIKAAKAYDEAAKKYFGVFARLNFPEGEYMSYMLDQKTEQEALKLIAECKAEKLDDVAQMLSYKSVRELEIMCKYLGCNISQLAGRVQRFSKGLIGDEKCTK